MFSKARAANSNQKAPKQPGARIPHVQQMEWTDCGAACLAQVLGYHGREVTLAEVRERMQPGRDGVSVRQILETSTYFGLRGRGVKADMHELHLLPRGAILHWEFNHFVVLDRVESGRVFLVDPAFGRREVKVTDLAKSFTGVAIVLEPTEQFTEKKRDKSSRYAPLFAEVANQRDELKRVLFISLMLRVFSLAMPLLTASVVDRVIPRGDSSLLTVILIGVAAMVLFECISTLIRDHLLLQLRAKMDSRMTLGFLDQLVALPYAFFQSRSTGDLLMRVRSNSTIREIVTTNTMSAVLDGIFVMLYAAAVIFVSPLMAGLIFMFTALNAIVFFATRNKQHQLMVRDLEIQAKSQDKLVQVIEGIQTLKCGGVEKQSVRAWSKLYLDEVNLSIERGTLSAWVDAVGGLLNAVAPMVLLAVGATQVISGELSIGAMLAVCALASGIFGPVESLLSSAMELQLLGSYLDRVEDVTHAKREQEGSSVVPAPALRGWVSAQDISFGYSSTDRPVVERVSLDVPPGACVAIVGLSGSGKSTLANLLSGLYEPSSGTVRYDGHALSSLDVGSVRRQIGIVPQSPYIFSGSIRDNISLAAPGATLDEVMRAADAACIHQDIMNMPMAYETQVSGGGSSLSGGQRQRVAIARAVLRHAPIMILDEATSALDAVTEKQVMENLKRLGATRVIIAHRLSTIADADQIVVLHEGRVMERGDHHSLLAQRGAYARLIELQGRYGDLAA